MKVPLGRSGWYFCDWNDPPPSSEYHEFHGSETYALRWLGQFRQDSGAMNDLHCVWARNSPQRLSDNEVLRQVSWWLRSGKVKARQPLIPIAAGGVVASPETAAPPRRPPPAPASGPAEDPATLPTDADLAAIAGVQRDAAEDGTALCEECARAPAAAQPA